MPGRPRSYRTLAFHLFRVVDAFLGANEGTTLVQEMFREEPAPDADTATLVAYGEKVRAALPRLVEQGRHRARQVAADLLRSADPARADGTHDLALGQHVRQYMMLLEKEGVSHHRPLVAADFAKLPMPQNVWDG